jgi:hypothetical protein
VLLVAHADTVFAGPPSSVEWHGNLAIAGKGGGSANKNGSAGYQSGYTWRSSGLGADDRAGCALAWTFRNSGHSLLITDEEEDGCVGASHAAAEIAVELGSHLFAVEVDRRGDCNAVFYSVSTDAFENWILETLRSPWVRECGSFSDIAAMCHEAGICGVNLAAGYYYEHTSQEIFSLDAWQRTRAGVERLLAHADRRWVLPPKPKKLSIWRAGAAMLDLPARDVSADDYSSLFADDTDCIHHWVQSYVYPAQYCGRCKSYSDGSEADADEIALEEEGEEEAWSGFMEDYRLANEAALTQLGYSIN